VPALVGVEGAEGAHQAHPVGFVSAVRVGWRHRGGAEVDGDGGKRATGKGGAKITVLLEERLLRPVVVGEDLEAPRLKNGWASRAMSMGAGVNGRGSRMG
jgi:hypothetical protein